MHDNRACLAEAEREGGELTTRNIFIICEHMKTISAAAAAVCLTLGCIVSGQVVDSGPEFEVAVVRENRSGETRGRIELVNARFTAINMTLRELVSVSYPAEGGGFRHASQLAGGPSWFETARFDVIAKAEGFQGDTNRPGFTATA